MRMMFAVLFSIIMAFPALAQEDGYQPDFLELDGTNGLSLIPDPEFSIAGSGTIEFWVQPDWTEDPGYDPVIMASAGEEGASYIIALLRDRDGIGVLSGENQNVVPFDFTDGKVHHVAIEAYDGETIIIIDGEVAGALGFGMEDLPASGVWIGTSDGESAAFKGAIAALRIWGVPVEPEALAEFRFRDVLSETGEPHPDLDYLQAVSDFENADVLTVEGEFAEGDEEE